MYLIDLHHPDLIYKYKTRPNKEAKKKKEKLKQTYILTKIQSLTDAKNQQQSQSITNLPKFTRFLLLLLVVLF